MYKVITVYVYKLITEIDGANQNARYTISKIYIRLVNYKLQEKGDMSPFTTGKFGNYIVNIHILLLMYMNVEYCKRGDSLFVLSRDLHSNDNYAAMTTDKYSCR